MTSQPSLYIHEDCNRVVVGTFSSYISSSRHTHYYSSLDPCTTMPNPNVSTHSNTAATTVQPQHPDTTYFRHSIAYVSSYFVDPGNSSATSSDAAMPSTAAAYELLTSAQSIMTKPIINATGNLFKSAVGSDLLIEVGSELVPAHQAIVLCRSPVLAKEYSHL